MSTPIQLGGNRQPGYSRHYHRKAPSETQISSKCRRTLERAKVAKRKRWLQAGALLLTLLSLGFIAAVLTSVSG